MYTGEALFSHLNLILCPDPPQLRSAVHDQEHVDREHDSEKDAEEHAGPARICACHDPHKVRKDTAQENDRQRDQPGLHDVAHDIYAGRVVGK